MKFRLLICAIVPVAFALALPASTTAQKQSAPEQRPGLTIRMDTDLVIIDVTATDKNGNYVRDLKENELEIYEDGKLKKIDFFAVTDEAALSRPLAVVFALDTSGSLKPEETVTLREAAMKFTELMRGDSVFAALTFNYDVKVLQNFTSDPRKLERAFAKADRFEGSTRIYDAIDRAVTMLDRNAPRARKTVQCGAS